LGADEGDGSAGDDASGGAEPGGGAEAEGDAEPDPPGRTGSERRSRPSQRCHSPDGVPSWITYRPTGHAGSADPTASAGVHSSPSAEGIDGSIRLYGSSVADPSGSIMNRWPVADSGGRDSPSTGAHQPIAVKSSPATTW
jgi:hypothetical protein